MVLVCYGGSVLEISTIGGLNCFSNRHIWCDPVFVELAHSVVSGHRHCDSEVLQTGTYGG